MFLASFCHCAQVLIFSPPLLQPSPSLFCAFHRPLSLILPCVDLPSPPNRCCSLRTRECKRRRPYSTMERSQGCRQCRQSPSPGRFARSGLLFFMVWPPAHLHHSITLTLTLLLTLLLTLNITLPYHNSIPNPNPNPIPYAYPYPNWIFLNPHLSSPIFILRPMRKPSPFYLNCY